MAAFGLINLEMKADNELAISLLTVYFKSVKKMKICVKKKTTKKMTKKSSKKKFLMAVGSRTLDLQCVTYCATTTIAEQNH